MCTRCRVAGVGRRWWDGQHAQPAGGCVFSQATEQESGWDETGSGESAGLCQGVMGRTDAFSI